MMCCYFFWMGQVVFCISSHVDTTRELNGVQVMCSLQRVELQTIWSRPFFLGLFGAYPLQELAWFPFLLTKTWLHFFGENCSKVRFQDGCWETLLAFRCFSQAFSIPHYSGSGLLGSPGSVKLVFFQRFWWLVCCHHLSCNNFLSFH